jgi:hypothetical protein
MKRRTFKKLSVDQPNSEKWKTAIQRELLSLEDSETWKAVERKPEDNIVEMRILTAQLKRLD